MNASAAALPIDTRTAARARHATRALFATLGTMAGVWGAHVPSVKLHYGLDEGTLALALLCGGLGAVLSLFVAGRFIARIGTRHAAGLTGLVMVLCVAIVLQGHTLAWLMAVNLLFGMAMSVHDMAINAEGTALEALGGKPIMGGLHGMFSVGAMGGALLASLLLHWQWPATLQFAVEAVVVAVVVVIAWRFLLDAHPAAAGPDGPARFVWPRGQLLVIGLLIFAGMAAEGIMYDWSVLYLKQERGQPQDQAALGYAAFAGAMAVARFGGDLLRAHWDDRRVLRVSAWLAAGAMAVALISPNAWVTLIGFALAGAGIAPVVPLLYTAASRVPGSSSAAAIAAASSIGYSGILVGPPLIGAWAKAASLSHAMWAVVIAAALLALGCARGLAPPPRAD